MVKKIELVKFIKKFDLKTNQKIKDFLNGTMAMGTKEKILYVKEYKLLEQFCQYNGVGIDYWQDIFKQAKNSDRIPMKLTWYFKVRKQYEPDNTNMTQLFEDEYQVKMD